MKLSVAIMAHPKRAHFVEELRPQLPGASIVWDRLNDRWDTGRRSLLAFDSSCDYHLVVQDDALLCPDFLAGAQEALSHVPAAPVSFYTGRAKPYAESVRRAVNEARAADRPWLAMQGPNWGVAVAVPTPLIEEMVRWCDRQVYVTNYDRRMEKYFTSRGILCWHSIPSLVNHRVGAENPSLIPGRGAALSRTAHEWIEDVSPLEIDWSRGAHMAPDCPAPEETRAGGPLPRKGSKLPRYALTDIYVGTGAHRALLARKGQRVPQRQVHLVDERDLTLNSRASRAPSRERVQGEITGSPAGRVEVPDGVVSDTSGLPPAQVDYTVLRMPDLRKLCAERGIKPPPRPRKADLIKLLEGAPS